MPTSDQPQRPGITFRETMRGPFALSEVDPERGRATGARANDELILNATIYIDDIERFEADPEHAGRIEGEVIFEPLGGPFPARGGRFNLFSPADEPDLKQMIYEVAFEHEGEPYYLAGHKDVRDDPGFDAWSDTTTLFTRLHRGTDASGPVVGAGVLSLGIDDLARLVATIRATGTESAGEGVGAVAAFGKFFLGALWERYAALASRDA